MEIKMRISILNIGSEIIIINECSVMISIPVIGYNGNAHIDGHRNKVMKWL